MLRRDRLLRTQLNQLLDATLFGLAFWFAHLFWSHFKSSFFPSDGKIEDFGRFLWMYLIIIPFSPLILETQGFYNRSFSSPRRSMIWALIRACLIMTGMLILVMFLVKGTLSRFVFLLFGVTSFLLVMAKEELLRWGSKSEMAQAQFTKRVILVGTPEETLGLRKDLKQIKSDGIEVVMDLDLNATSVSELIGFVHEHSINGVILNARNTLFGDIEKAIQACELEGVEAWLVANFFKTQFSRTSLDEFYGRPVLVFRSTPETSWQGIGKQMLDFTGAVFLVLLSSWLLAAVAIVIKLSSPGPVFFRQRRSGLNGRPFTMYKFRSMVTNAEQLKQELAQLNEMTGPVFKVTNDPRITPIGKLLRKFSIDELPQLFNILKGEMSLVGPRPLPVDEVSRFDDLAHRRRLSVKPGLTGLWQVSGRNEVSNFKEWVRLDLEYIDNWSLWLDVKILIRTIPVVLFAKGSR